MVFEKVRDMIASQLQVDASTITPESRLVEDLKADSANVMVVILELESEFGITRSTASRVLRLMEQKGLVERQSVPQDARLKKLVLTPKALAVHEGVISRIRATEARITKDVTPEELEQFFAITAKFRRNLE